MIGFSKLLAFDIFISEYFFYFIVFFFASKQMVLCFSKTGLFCFVVCFFFLAAESSSQILRITRERERVQVKTLLSSPDRIRRLLATRF